MTKERELLRRALDAWDRPASDKFSVIFEEVRTYLSTPSDDAEEPVKCKRCNGTGAIKTGEIDCYPDGTPYMNGPVICVEDCPDCHPPRPAEQEAEPVAWIKRQYAGTGNVLTSIFYCPEPGAIPLYTKPAEPEAETIETLRAENFKLASGQCTEGGPWGDEGGTPYCKYAKRKPMTEDEAIELCPFTREEFKAGFLTGVRFAEKHHGITDADV